MYASISTMKNKILKGIIKITPKPLGFLMLEGVKGDSDVIIFEEELNCALDRDEVEVEVIGKDRDRKKGRVTKILNRNKTKFVGTIEKSGSRVIFKPDDFKFYKDIEITGDTSKLESGIKAQVELIPPSKFKTSLGKRIVPFLGVWVSFR